jgi:hypothetical protein
VHFGLQRREGADAATQRTGPSLRFEPPRRPGGKRPRWLSLKFCHSLLLDHFRCLAVDGSGLLDHLSREAISRSISRLRSPWLDPKNASRPGAGCRLATALTGGFIPARAVPPADLPHIVCSTKVRPLASFPRDPRRRAHKRRSFCKRPCRSSSSLRVLRPQGAAKNERRAKSGCANSVKSRSRNRRSSPPSRWATADMPHLAPAPTRREQGSARPAPSAPQGPHIKGS